MKRPVTARLLTLGILAAALAVPASAQAGGEGSRRPAAAGHMSSYVRDPYHDPRSLHSQRRGTGQILGAPMFHEASPASLSRQGVVDPHWASGTAHGRVRR